MIAGRGGELGGLVGSGGFAEVPDGHAWGFDGLKAPGSGDGEADEIRVHLAHVLSQGQEGAGVIAAEGAVYRVDAEEAQSAPTELRGLEAPLLDPGRAAGVRLVPIDASEVGAGRLVRRERGEAAGPGEDQFEGRCHRRDLSHPAFGCSSQQRATLTR
jgi:hypothetical protein